MNKDRESYHARLQILAFFFFSDVFPRVCGGELEFDLNKESKLINYADLEVFTAYIKDYKAELAKLRKAAIEYIVNGAPDGSKASDYENHTTERLAELVKEIRDNF